jgi:hypothetical protein
MQMQPTFKPPVQTQLTLVERTLLRQANLRAAERCAVAELDLKARLEELIRITNDGPVAASQLPPAALADLRVAVEDFTSSARTLYPSAEDLLVALKQTVSDAVAPDDAHSRDFIQIVMGWSIEAYFAR